MADNWKLLLDGLQWLLTVGVAVTVWLRKPGEDAMNAVLALEKEIRQRVGDTTDRLTKIEVDLRHMPTSDDIGELKGSFRTLEERTRNLADGIDGVRAALLRMDQWLRERDAR